MKNTVILLAAGRGKRMNSKVQKQYLLIKEKPLLYYSLNTFQKSEIIDEIILVVGKGEIPYCKKEIVEKYGFTKVGGIVEGGKERYDSVACGLSAVKACDYVYIHDGARPFIDLATIRRLQHTVEEEKACVAAVPSKDTVKLAGADDYVAETPDRSRVWVVQTPQVFDFALVKSAYAQFLAEGNQRATDDAMVVEQMTGQRVKLVKADYRNIKVTTPEDLEVAEIYAKETESDEELPDVAGYPAQE